MRDCVNAFRCIYIYIYIYNQKCIKLAKEKYLKQNLCFRIALKLWK